MSLADNWRVEDALMEEDMKKNLVEETPIEEVIETPEEEPMLDPDEITSEDFGVICKQGGEVIAYGFWKGTRANNKRLENWAEYGYERTNDKYVQGYDGKWYVEGSEPEKPQAEIELERIAELKAKLQDTDYVVIKIAEGEATQEEYAEVLANRKAWRKEINDLEKENV